MRFVCLLVLVGCSLGLGSSAPWMAIPAEVSSRNAGGENPAEKKTVEIEVLSLFHPREMELRSAGAELVVKTNKGTLFVGPRDHLTIQALASSLLVTQGETPSRTRQLRVTDRNQGATDFILRVPGKISRHYRGELKIQEVEGVLEAVITMDLETAVASVVAAESLPGTPIEALRAQAIVSRSYLVASAHRHANFDFCDLTHCQFLREPPAQGSPASRAASTTQGFVLTFHQKAIATMFTPSCPGYTKTPRDIGIPEGEFHYSSVFCDACYRHPIRWTRTLSSSDAATLANRTEAERLAVVRRLGWKAVPSNSFGMRDENGEVVLDGRGEGHGVGLCQRGAAAMALEGSSAEQILQHYFPGATVAQYSTETHTPLSVP